MTARLSLAVVVSIGLCSGACGAPNQQLEHKVDEVAHNQRDPAELQRKVDELTAELARLRERDQALAHQIDELADLQQKTLDRRPPAPPPRPRRGEPDPKLTYAIPIDGDPSVGPGDAKVTLVLLYDYADPFTDKSRGTLDELRKKYGKDLRIVYKPFIVHPQTATAAALAACAAHKQHRFAELDALLWDKGFKARQFDQSDVRDSSPPQKCWESPTGCPIVLGFARELHLDVGKFKVEMQNCLPWVTGQMEGVRPFAVGATPTFYINGRNLVGAMPIDNFIPVIDEELARATERIRQGTPPAKYYQQWIVDKGKQLVEAP